MKQGSKIEYGGKFWIVDSVYRSFIHVYSADDATICKYIYKDFYNEVKVVNE